MISENARNYENVVIRNEQEIGINNFGLDYMVGLEDEIERLNKLLSIEKDYRERFDKDNQRLHSIIKEVREYIQDRYDGEVLTHTFDKCNVGELLGILDKGE